MTLIQFESKSIKPRVLVLLLIAALIPVSGQVSTGPQRSPSKLIEEFWNIETSGGRLTSEGLYSTSRFFIRSGLSAGWKVVNVTRNGSSDFIEETARTPTWTEVSVTTDGLGQIDSLLRFTPSPTRGPQGVMILKGPVLTFDLVLSGKQWKVNRDGGRELESVVPLQWLITCGGDTAWINLDTAIVYVKDIAAKTKDPIIRRNAGKTLQRLTHLNSHKAVDGPGF
jgi:hypothetical protein